MREEEAPEPTQLVKAALTLPFSISTGLPKVPYCKRTHFTSFLTQSTLFFPLPLQLLAPVRHGPDLRPVRAHRGDVHHHHHAHRGRVQRRRRHHDSVAR